MRPAAIQTLFVNAVDFPTSETIYSGSGLKAVALIILVQIVHEINLVLIGGLHMTSSNP